MLSPASVVLAAMGLLTAPALMFLLMPPAAAAHHVGLYTPRDNEVSANFKRVKFALQAGKPEVALSLFETGALRQEMRARAAALPPGLEQSTRAALKTGDARAAELHLMIFFAGLVRDLAREADRQLADSTAGVEARAVTGRRFLEAIWRYYNLIDFVVSQRDNKAAVAVRLAFDEAETYVKSDSPVKSDPPRPAVNPDRVREPLRRIAETLGRVIEQSSGPGRQAVSHLGAESVNHLGSQAVSPSASRRSVTPATERRATRAPKGE